MLLHAAHRIRVMLTSSTTFPASCGAFYPTRRAVHICTSLLSHHDDGSRMSQDEKIKRFLKSVDNPVELDLNANENLNSHVESSDSGFRRERFQSHLEDGNQNSMTEDHDRSHLRRRRTFTRGTRRMRELAADDTEQTSSVGDEGGADDIIRERYRNFENKRGFNNRSKFYNNDDPDSNFDSMSWKQNVSEESRIPKRKYTFTFSSNSKTGVRDPIFEKEEQPQISTRRKPVESSVLSTETLQSIGAVRAFLDSNDQEPNTDSLGSGNSQKLLKFGYKDIQTVTDSSRFNFEDIVHQKDEKPYHLSMRTEPATKQYFNNDGRPENGTRHSMIQKHTEPVKESSRYIFKPKVNCYEDNNSRQSTQKLPNEAEPLPLETLQSIGAAKAFLNSDNHQEKYTDTSETRSNIIETNKTSLRLNLEDIRSNNENIGLSDYSEGKKITLSNSEKCINPMISKEILADMFSNKVRSSSSSSLVGEGSEINKPYGTYINGAEFLDKPNIKEEISTTAYVRAVPRTGSELTSHLNAPVESPVNSRLVRVAILGLPNTGKSTLVNALMEDRVCSVSSKIHTTQTLARAITNIDETQIVILDTPGIVTPEQAKRFSLSGPLVQDSERSLSEADLLLVLVDGKSRYTRLGLHPRVMRLLALHTHLPAILVINKVDLMKKGRSKLGDLTRKLTDGIVSNQESLETSDSKCIPKHITAGELADKYLQFDEENVEADRSEQNNEDDYLIKCDPDSISLEELTKNSTVDTRLKSRWEPVEQVISEEDVFNQRVKLSEAQLNKFLGGRVGWPKFDKVLVISALTGQGVQDLRDILAQYAKANLWMFNASLPTDQDPYQLAVLTVREKFLDRLKHQLPYELKFEIEHWELGDADTLHIVVRVTCPRTAMISLLVGARGVHVTQLARQAEKELVDTFKTDVRLRLNVVAADAEQEAKKQKNSGPTGR